MAAVGSGEETWPASQALLLNVRDSNSPQSSTLFQSYITQSCHFTDGQGREGICSGKCRVRTVELGLELRALERVLHSLKDLKVSSEPDPNLLLAFYKA